MPTQTSKSLSQTELDARLVDLDRVIAGDPQDWKAYRDRGWIYAHKHEFDRALADLDTALRLRPDDARAYTRRGHVWKAAGQMEKAAADYTAALRLDPANADVYKEMIRKTQAVTSHANGPVAGKSADVEP